MRPTEAAGLIIIGIGIVVALGLVALAWWTVSAVAS